MKTDNKLNKKYVIQISLENGQVFYKTSRDGHSYTEILENAYVYGDRLCEINSEVAIQNVNQWIREDFADFPPILSIQRKEVVIRLKEEI